MLLNYHQLELPERLAIESGFQQVRPLGHRKKKVWPANPNAVGGRRQRKGGPYQAFYPDAIADRTFEFDDQALVSIVEATKAISELNTPSKALTSFNALASNLLRSESSSSSRIEGLRISPKRLAREELAQSRGKPSDDKVAEILGNVAAMKKAIQFGTETNTISISDICEIHRELLRHTSDQAIAGVIRKEQNWIGGNDYNPIGAVYVPPPPEEVEPLLDDLCAFLERDDLPSVAKAAILHAQFENIHPFADGNGRVGRSLIYTVLKRGGEVERFIPPVSVVFSAELRTYQSGFGIYSAGRVGEWCEIFAEATERACDLAARFVQKIENLQSEWLGRLGQPRSDAAVRQLVDALPGQPVIDVTAAIEITGKSRVAVQKALNQLEKVEILSRLDQKKWGRAWESNDLLLLAEELEDSIVSG